MNKHKKSGEYCCAVNCANSRYKKPDLSFYRFPKDAERCKRWIENCRRLEWLKVNINTICGKRSLCEEHFEASQLMNPSLKGKPSKHKHLRMDAVPTLFNFPHSPRPVTLIQKILTSDFITQTDKKDAHGVVNKSNVLLAIRPANVLSACLSSPLTSVHTHNAVNNSKIQSTEPTISSLLKPVKSESSSNSIGNDCEVVVRAPEKPSLLKPINSLQEAVGNRCRLVSARNNPTIVGLRRLLQKKRTIIFRLRKKLAKSKAAEVCDEEMTKKQVMQLLESVKKHFDSTLYSFIKAQFVRKMFNKKKNWSLEELRLPLAIYQTSGNVYRMLSKIMALPSTRTLQRYLLRKSEAKSASNSQNHTADKSEDSSADKSNGKSADKCEDKSTNVCVDNSADESGCDCKYTDNVTQKVE